MRIRWSLLLAGVLLAGVLGGAAVGLAEDVGQFTRVVNQVDQLKQGKEPALPAKVPNGVANQDQVQTRDQSMAVVHFVDDSTMTISPKSKVTIEDYMYDANKGKAAGTIKVMQGVVETVIPATEKLQQKDIQIRTTTAIAGIRGTKLVTVAKPEGTVFYVVPEVGVAKPKPSTVRIRLYSPETQPDAPAVLFVQERLKKKEPLRQILEEGLEAHHDPCDLIKAAVLLGVTTEQLAADFQKVCMADPELKQVCAPCIILKCTVEAMRSLKEVDISEGQYGILLKNLAPISGNLKAGDLAAIANLTRVGAEGQIPNYPPSQQQVDAAKLPQTVNQIADTLIKNGADPAEVNNCRGVIGGNTTPGADVLAYSPATVGENQNTGTGSGSGGVSTEQQASAFK
jgi:hypothetical protein